MALHCKLSMYCDCLGAVQSGATESIKKVGELFPWSPGRSRMCYTSHNHTSCVGLRCIAATYGVEVGTVDPPLTGLSVVRHRGTPCRHELSFQQAPRVVVPADPSRCCEDAIPENLFVLSAECYFSGVKTDLAVGPALQSGAVFGASACDVSCRVTLAVSMTICACYLVFSKIDAF